MQLLEAASRRDQPRRGSGVDPSAHQPVGSARSGETLSESDELSRKSDGTGFGATQSEGPTPGSAPAIDATLPSPTPRTAPPDNWAEWTESAPVPLDTVPPLLGRFRLLRRLGHGGMGDVWQAADLQLRTTVALKTIRRNLADRPEIVEMMRQEVLLARKVSHPNVCRLFEFFAGVDADGRALALFTMELMEGATLAQFLKEHGPVSRREALPLLREMAEGLNAAHAEGVVHRDFKPGNVMLVEGDPRRRAVVMDFGIARREATEWRHGAESPAGTPAYIAPEQARGDAPTLRSDVYSFATVAEEMVTGLRSGVGAVPRKWRRALDKGRANDPQLRFESPLAMVRHLEPSRAGRFVLAVAIVLVLAAGVMFWRRAAGVEATVAALVEESRRLYLAYDYPAALRAADEALALDSRAPMAHYNRSRVLASLGRDREAERPREAALTNASRASLPDQLLIQASYWMHAGKREQAGEIAKRLYEISPGDHDHLRAYAYFIKPAERLALYERVRSSGSPLAGHPYFHISEAVRASEAGDESRRIAALDRLDALKPGPEFRFLVATALQVRESHSFYMEDWEEALRLLADAEQIYRQAGHEYDFLLARLLGRRALVYRFGGDLPKSVAVNAEAIRIFEALGSHSELCLSLAHQADALAAQGLLRAAEKSLERVEALVPQSELRQDLKANCRDYWSNRAFLAREMGHLDRARASLDASTKLSPGGGFYGPAVLQLQRAYLLYEQDSLSEALEFVEKMNIGDTAPMQSERQLLRGMLGLELGRTPLAEEARGVLRAESTRSVAMREAATKLGVRMSSALGTPADRRQAVAIVRRLERGITSVMDRNEARLLALKIAFSVGATEVDRQELRELLAWSREEGAKRLELEGRMVALADSRLAGTSRRSQAKALADEAEGLGYLRIARRAREGLVDSRTAASVARE